VSPRFPLFYRKHVRIYFQEYHLSCRAVIYLYFTSQVDPNVLSLSPLLAMYHQRFISAIIIIGLGIWGEMPFNCDGSSAPSVLTHYPHLRLYPHFRHIRAVPYHRSLLTPSADRNAFIIPATFARMSLLYVIPSWSLTVSVSRISVAAVLDEPAGRHDKVSKK
jgi:hypothetical protein